MDCLDELSCNINIVNILSVLNTDNQTSQIYTHTKTFTLNCVPPAKLFYTQFFKHLHDSKSYSDLTYFAPQIYDL